MPKVKIKLVVNPRSGRYKGGRALSPMKEYLARGGSIVDAVVTQRPSDGIAIAREAAAEGYDVVVACGGDGTLREIVSGLVGTEVNLVEAYKWLAVCVEKKPDANEEETVLKKVADKMQPAELERAKKEAAELIDKYVSPQDRESKRYLESLPGR